MKTVEVKNNDGSHLGTLVIPGRDVMTENNMKLPKGFKVVVYKVEDDMWDMSVWRDGAMVLSTSGTAFHYRGEARACGIRRAWDIQQGKEQWT